MFAVFLAASLLFHLLWEIAQMPLYAGFPQPMFPWCCVYATFTGDMLFTMIIYLALAIMHRNIRWASDRSAYEHPATWALSIIIGVLLAVSTELRAVHLFHTWDYGPLMPMIPVLQVGLTPVLQMIVVPSLTLLACRLFLQRRKTER